jgi:hypothetical protein
MQTGSGHLTVNPARPDLTNERAMMTEDRVRNWNEDKPWSEMDLFDLQNNVARGDLVEETAEFLMRREDEVRGKIRELRTGVRKKTHD